MNKWYKASIGFGIFPLITGTSIYLIWLVTKAEALMMAGSANIIIGLFCVLAAVACLIIYGIKNRKKEKRFIKKLLVSLFIIFINFPAALAMISSVYYELSTYNIVIINNSDRSVKNFSISERDSETVLGDIDSRDMLEKTIHFLHEGSVGYKFSLNGKDYSGTLFGYVTGGMPVSVELTVTEDNEVRIEHR